MFSQFLNNQKGSMSLVLTIGVAAISGIVIFQMSSTFGTLNNQQNRQKSQLNSSKQLLEVSRMMKKSLTMGQLDPSCASQFDGDKFEPTIVNGHTFCFPKTGGLCATDSETGQRLCVSTNIAALQIPVAGTLRRPSAIEIQSDEEYGSMSQRTEQSHYSSMVSARHTRIRVPSSGNKLWRNCDGASDICLRLVICEDDSTDCEMHGGERFQVINLSSM